MKKFGWIDSLGIVNGSVETWWMYPAFGGAIIVLLLASAAVFYKKRLLSDSISPRYFI